MVMHMNRIKELRTEADMKQTDLADRIGVSRTLVSKYERENVDLSTEYIRSLCSIFGVTADYLLGLSEIRSYSLTEDEYLMVQAYRVARPKDRGQVDYILEEYKNKKTAAG